MAGLFAVAVIRLVYVQVLGSGDYVAYGEEQRIQPIELSGGRGSIFDRNGTDLAISIPQTTIAADPSVIADPAAAARRLAPAMGRDEGELLQALSSDGRFVYLQRQVGDDVAARVRDLDIDGVLLYDEQTRFYPAGELGRALLGQVDPDGSGVSGVEQAFDGDLSGEPGRLMVERDPSGRTIPAGRHQIDPAVPGDDLVLTLDGSLQYQVENILANQVQGTGAQAGVAIVSNPETGEILALANVALDPASGIVGITGNDLAVTANYEPGSVNKVITLAAALEEGLVTPEDVVSVPSSLQVADHTYYDSHPGDLTVTEVLAKSSNVGTIKLAQQLGKDRIDEYLRRFGFGRVDRARTAARGDGPAARRRRVVGDVDRLDPHRPGHLGHGAADALRLQRHRQRRRLRAPEPGQGHRGRGRRAPRRPARRLPAGGVADRPPRRCVTCSPR